ncbi:PAC2 family protein [Bifidobacterium eulemuris]|uniref:PAC2 family n=1 Tax=Bifidobacterium eulemuris TaxID=1765219 RepID=A0A261GDG5_9BIFI|nr:PAC2 family protein [Bifidobacterium eulemuris]OZG69175.1 PAC2 family [Bifidobacterium eulemuris]QOL31312.1 PAC2 family protein [Bifidobacterium eulemuris]
MTEDTKQRSGLVMVAAFDGWNDACQAATNVIRHLVKRYESREIRHISCDGFYDYQVSRPMMCHVTGRARIIWPQTTFYEIALSHRQRIIAQIAPEPNYRWREYCRQSLHIAEELDVDHVVTLGAMFADCPHTRPLPISISSGSRACEDDRQYNGPIGIPTVLDAMAGEAGFATTSMWVSLPQYLGSEECAQGTLELMRGLSCLTGIEFDESGLAEKTKRWEAQASMLLRCNDHLADYVRHLEREYDLNAEAERDASIGAPQAEQLVKETEDFLRSIG